MNIRISFGTSVLFFSLSALSAQPEPSATSEPPFNYQVVERGPHHRVWSANVLRQDLVTGTEYEEPHSFVELATGMHYWDQGQWLESEAKFEITPTGFLVARHGQHQAILSPNLNSALPLDWQTSGGQRLKSRIFGLCYFDPLTGQNVLIGEIKDCEAELVAPNVVLYRDAFTDIQADVRITYRLDGWEQDVILRETPPAPSEYQMDDHNSQLAVLTEWFDTPDPVRLGSASPDGLGNPDAIVTGEDNDFGWPGMRVGQGKAFQIGVDGQTPQDDPGEGMIVKKSWQKIEGRQFLIEFVPFRVIRPLLDTLPPAKQASVRPAPAQPGDPTRKTAFGSIPRRPDRAERPIQTAKVTSPSTRSPGQSLKRGVVLDYTTINTGLTNYIFKGDTTYYVTAPVTLSGTTTVFEGGAVIKYMPGVSARLFVTSPINWQATPYRPVVMTAQDDNSVGETVATNTLSGYYADTALKIDAAAAGTNVVLQNLRIAYALSAIGLNGQTNHIFSHAQFINCQNGIQVFSPICDFSVRNALFCNVANVIYGSSGNATVRGEHWTVATATWLNYNGTCPRVFLTNCLLAAVTNLGTNSPNTVTVLGSTNGVFQAVGQGAYYLVGGSPYRNAGTTNINATLAGDLTRLTTYPPLILANDISTSITLAPQAQRDIDQPDLGYHYDPLDYVFSGLNLSNATLTWSNGIAIGIYGPTGLNLQSGARLVSEGTAARLNRLARYQAVQEQPVIWGTSPTTMSLFVVTNTFATLPEVRLRFTDVSLLSDANLKRYFLNVNTYSMIQNLALTDCQLRGGYLYFLPYYADARTMTVAVTNSLVERVVWSFTQGYSGSTAPFAVYLRNNLFRYGTVTLVYSASTAPWHIYDNLFDQAMLYNNSYAPPNSYNGYYVTTALPGGGNNKNLASLSYQAGPFGPYYLPSNSELTNAGSRTAANAGLYHYTILTNQTKEASTQVDIGLHYVALVNGSPADADNDGLPDYFEDRNGDGDTDAGETDLNNPDTDGDGRNDGQEIAEGTDALDANSFEPVRLGYWKFNTSDLKGEQGEAPIASSGVIYTNSFDGHGVQLNTNSGAVLRYRETEPNGKVNITPKNMSIRFMFKPGTNQASEKRLWEYGNPDSAAGGMALTLDSYGTNLVFKSRDGSGNVFSANGAVSSGANTWWEYQLTITKPIGFTNYTVNVWRFFEKIIDYATPVNFAFPFPPASARSSGFCIGSSADGTKQAGGVFDEFETFNYDLGVVGNQMNGLVFSAEPSSDQTSLMVKWRISPNQRMDLKRRSIDGTNWTSLVSSNTVRSYIDTNLQSGYKYVYGLFTSYDSNLLAQTTAGLNIAAIENRGRILLLVDTTLSSALSTNISQLQQDLVGDGWTVTSSNAPRHDTWAWRSNMINTVQNSNCVWVKNVISNSYRLSNDLKAVFLIGHVTAPYSGAEADDGHTGVTNDPANHYGAWPADGYYGDTNNAWSDTSVNYPNTYNPILNNIPGDGKYDQNTFPSNLEVAVGRIDFDWMRSFTNTISEPNLIKRYLDKLHRYRQGQTLLPNRAVAGSYFSEPEQYVANYGGNLFDNAVKYSSKMFGFESGKILDGDLFIDKRPCQWGFLAGFGGGNGICQTNVNTTNHYHCTADLTVSTNEPPINIYMLMGSYFVDWMAEDDFIRGVLAMPNYGVASVWTRTKSWNFGTLAMGGTLGDALLDTVNSDPTTYSCRSTYILGDPTLRNFITPAITNLAACTAPGSVTLTWNPASDPSAQYLVYRTTNAAFNSPTNYAKLTPNPIAGNSFTDSITNLNAKVYQVRVVNKLTNGSGSFTNLSTGVFITVN